MRYEYKHLIANEKIDQLRAAIAPFVQIDPYAANQPGQQYTVRSIYFDTVRWSMYDEKNEGIAFRDKIRLRAYNEWYPETVAFLEIKRKYQLPSRKFRVSANYDTIIQCFKGGNIDELFKNKSEQKRNDAKRFFYQLYSKQLLPVVLVCYEREPFIGYGNPENNLRITFDKKVRGYPFPGLDELFHNQEMRLAMPGYTVLEVKFNHYFPLWLKPIIAAFQLKREAISKYANSLDVLRLPHQYGKPTQLRMKAKFWSKHDTKLPKSETIFSPPKTPNKLEQ